MMTVRQISRITGVSVRTLHHYDEIGLLPPSDITAAGYRLYDDTALRRLHSILLLKELQFALKDIKAILDRPDYDPIRALDDQIRLLTLQRERLDEIIRLAKQIRSEGVNSMSFDAFDRTDIDRYANEAREKWGNTAAWSEFEKKPKQDHQKNSDALMAILAETGKLMHLSPADDAVQQLISRLQAHITQCFYPCTNEILAGLGKMYTADERFRRNIDKAAGEGAAEFVSHAIAHFVQK